VGLRCQREGKILGRGQVGGTSGAEGAKKAGETKEVGGAVTGVGWLDLRASVIRELEQVH
jgi:hypothetical protein